MFCYCLKIHRDKVSIGEWIRSAEQRASRSSGVIITQFSYDEGTLKPY